MTDELPPIEKLDFFLFRVFTDKGRFHLWVEAADWESAEDLARPLFEVMLGFKVKELRRAKYETGESAETSSLSVARPDDLSTDPPWRGMRFYAGKNIWQHVGRGVEYEAEVIRFGLTGWDDPPKESDGPC